MTGYRAGEVSAKISLDTSEFKEAIESLKGEVKGLKGAFNNLKGNNSFADEVKKLKSEIDSLKKVNEDYRKQLNNLRKGTNDVTNATKTQIEQLKQQRETWNEMSESMKNSSKSAEQNKKVIEDNIATVKKHNAELKETIALAKETNQNAIGNKYYWGGNPKDGKASVILGLEQVEAPAVALAEKIRALGEEMAAFSSKSTQNAEAISQIKVEYESLMQNLIQLGYEFQMGGVSVEEFKVRLAELEGEFAKVSEGFEKAVEEAKKAAEAFKQVEKATQKYDTLAEHIERLKTQIAAMSEVSDKSRQALSVDARYATILGNQLNSLTLKFQNGKISVEEYLAGLLKIEGQLSKLHTEVQLTTNEINQGNIGLEKTKPVVDQVSDGFRGLNNNLETTKKAIEMVKVELDGFVGKSGRTITSLSAMGGANELYSEVSKISQIINHFSSLSEKNKKALSGMGEQAVILKDKLLVLETAFNEGKISAETFDAELTKIAEKLKLLGSSTQKTVKEMNMGEAAMNKMSNGMTKTAHSGRILSNTLYQIRGALLSLKMIATAMGGMALWGFAMDIAEGVKQTFTAKNEMEAQLNQNAKVGASGINTFNRALDGTIERFAKINKYQLGETVSSIGLEFELTSKQMEKAMPIVAMIQSEYVRAGRTSEEAALAVKDILQGEFQRLSRETGVGKEELLAYGWSGDKEDVESLLNALKKAAEDRHWDTFAEKATSLNDVLQITKSRFEEFGADLLQAISPAIVSGFNTIIDIISGLQKAFNGLGSFGKNSIVAGGVLGGLVTLGTALPMITKGMGLADIATIGWGKSIATAALNLNKASVAQYGFRKALAEVITGTKASELANVRSTKAIMGRILGVNQAYLAEHGYGTALVQSKAKLMNHTGATNIAKISSMGLAQKTAYLTNNMKLQDAQALSTSRAVLKTATSFKVLKAVLMGILAIGVVAWFTSLATWADTVKKNIDGFNEVVDNGDEMVKDAKKSVSDYESALSKLTKGTKEYKKASNNLEIAKANQRDIETANTLAKSFKKINEETEKNISNRHKAQMAASYEATGMDMTAASERASGWTAKVLAGQQAMAHSMSVYEDRLYKSSQHVNEHVKFLKEAGVSQEKMVKYIDEYSAKAEEVADYWKKFNQGDLTAGAYAVLGELQLMWIDLWNDEHFLNFWESVKKTWRDVKPTVDEITKALGDLGHSLLDFFSTDQGQIVGGAIAIGAAIAGIGIKIAPTLKKLKDFASTIGDALGKLKNWRKENGSDSPTSDEKTPKTEEVPDLPKSEDVGLKEGLLTDFKGNVRKYASYAEELAGLFVLVNEAILLLDVTMGNLALTGWIFKQNEPNIRKGIEGLQLIAPTVMALMIPMIAFMAVIGHFNISTSTLMEGFKTAAVGVALAITLVTEAIVLLNLPLLGLAILGSVYGGVQDAAQQGIKAMQVCNDALMALVPWVPVFAAGIALAAVTIGTEGIGGLAILAAASGIAIGIGLVTEAIILLCIPLEAISEVGANFPDLSNARQGAEAMKTTAEALKYVEEGLAKLVEVQWDTLKSNIASLLGVSMDTALTDLTKEGGFLTQLEEFSKQFNNLTFTPINQDKVAALKTVGDGVKTINEAMQSVKTAMENLPDEFKNGGNGTPMISYDAETDSTSIVGSGNSEGYFDSFIEPLKQLKAFIDKFNNSPELDFTQGIENLPARIEAVKTAASMLEEIKGAVDSVKQTMGMIADSGWNQNMASGGISAAVSGWLTGLSPGGNIGGAAEGYSSSLGSSLKEMENVVKDIVTFNNNINTLVSGGNGDGNGGDTGGAVNAMANMVTAVDQAIQGLVTTLQNAVPQAKSAANGIGTGIREGIKTGIGDLTTITVQPLTQALNTAKSYGHTYGQGVGYQTTEGYKTGLKIKSATETEISGTLEYLESKKQDFYDKGKALGEAVSQGYKDGEKIHSPGIIATSTFQEMAYVEQAFDDAIAVIPGKAEALGASLAESYSPQIATDVGLTDMTAFESGLAQIGLVATDTDMITTNAFNNMNMSASTSMTGMTTSINGAFTNINVNATQSYAKLTNTTRTSLKNMQDQTTKNISAIRTSWKGMQVALIASAEQIRSETSSKIHQLESNMASFWNKIQNPANLLSAGNPMMAGHTRPQRRPTGISSNKGSRRMLAAGHPALGQRVTGISDRFKSIGSDSKTRERFAEYLQCLLNGGVCAAGGSGWHFNWSKEIQDVFMQWHTHFGEIYDPYLRVGKFENDDFPVRGISEIALRYIEDAIGRTSYEFYYDERYSPLEAWNRGSFNCVDGANLAIAFANAFGFPGGSLQYTTWDGIGHAYASIPGLGVIDATAIQGGYGLTASKVSYAGNPHTVNRNAPTRSNVESGNTIQGDIVFNIKIEGDVEDAEEKGKEVGRKASEVFINMFKRSDATGM